MNSPRTPTNGPPSWGPRCLSTCCPCSLVCLYRFLRSGSPPVSPGASPLHIRISEPTARLVGGIRATRRRADQHNSKINIRPGKKWGNAPDRTLKLGEPLHHVLPVGDIYFKSNLSGPPIVVGTEMAMYSFYGYYVGGGIIPSALMLFKDKENGDGCVMRICQASLAARGMQLSEFLAVAQYKPELYDQIDRRSFSGMVLASLITNPGDYKPDNLFIYPSIEDKKPEEKFVITGIDNDVAFVDPIVVSKNNHQHTLQMLNVLLLLIPKLSNPVVESSVVERIINQPPEVTILQWMVELEQYNQLIEPIIKDQKLEYTTWDAHQIPFRFRKGTISTMVKKMRLIRALLLDDPHKKITLQSIFFKLMPVVERTYESIERNYAARTVVDQYLKLQRVVIEEVVNLREILPSDKRVFQVLREETATPLVYEICTQSLHEAVAELLKEFDLEIFLKQNKGIRGGDFYLDLMKLLTTHFEITALQSLHPSWHNPHQLSLLRNRLNQPTPSMEQFITSLAKSLRKIEKSMEQVYHPVPIETPLHLVINETKQSLNLYYSELDLKFSSDSERINFLFGPPNNMNTKVMQTLINPLMESLWGMRRFIHQVDQQGNTPFDLVINQVELIDIIITFLQEFKIDYFKLVDIFRLTDTIFKSENKKIIEKWDNCLKVLEENPLFQWKMSWQILFPPLRDSGDEVTSFKTLTMGKRILKDSVQKQLFGVGPKRKGALYGRREVIKITEGRHCVYLKKYPALAAIEYAVGELLRKTIGFGAPYCEIVRIGDVPYLVSQRIVGITLREALEISPNLDQWKLHSHSISAMIIMSMIVSPEDGKDDNFILEQYPHGGDTYRIISIDNDQSFVPPYSKDSKSRNVRSVKSILWCLNEMKDEISPDLVSLFKNMNVTELLSDWLVQLNNLTLYFSTLFTTNEVQELLNKYNCFIEIGFTQEMMWTIFDNITLMKSIILGNPNASHWDIFHRFCLPIKQEYFKVKAKDVKRRFLEVDGKYFSSGPNGLVSVTMASELLERNRISTSNITKVTKDIRLGKGIGPAACIECLQNFKKNLSLKNLTNEKDILNFTETEMINFFKSLKWMDMDASEQRKWLKIMNSKRISELHLEGCWTLDDGFLLSWLNVEDLVSVNLANTTITESSVIILSKAVNLSYLDLSSTKIVNFTNIKLLWSLPFPKLTYLNLSNCLSLEKLILSPSPLLKELHIRNCERLKTLILELPRLAYFDATNVPIVDDSGLDMIISTSPHLNTLYISDTSVKYPSCRELLPQTKWKTAVSYWESTNISDKQIHKAISRILDSSLESNLRIVKDLIFGYEDKPIPLPPTENPLYGILTTMKISNLDLKRRIFSKEGLDVVYNLLQNNTTLTSLKLNSNKVGYYKIPLQTIVNCPNLKILYLKDNDISSEDCRLLREILKNNRSLKYLDLSKNLIAEKGFISILSALKTNKTLKKLILQDTLPKSTRELDLPPFTNKYLKILDISNNRLPTESCTVLKNFASLTEINLTNILPTHGRKYVEALVKILEGQNPCSLNLSSNNISSNAWLLLQYFENATNMTDLNLSLNNISHEYIESFTPLFNFNLTFLDLSGNDLHSVMIESRPLFLIPSLTSLCLSDNPLPASELDIFTTKLHLNNNLKQLFLKNTHLFKDNEEVKDTRELFYQFGRTIANLEWIDLSKNEVPPHFLYELLRGISSVSTGKTNSWGLRLDLNDNKIGDYQLEECEKLFSSKILDISEISLSHNQFTSKGLSCLSSMLSTSQRLRLLDLAMNNIKETQILAEGIEKNSNLARLDLNGNNIDDNGAEPLRRMLFINTALIALDLSVNATSHQEKDSISLLTERNLKKSLFSKKMIKYYLSPNDNRAKYWRIEKNYVDTTQTVVSKENTDTIHFVDPLTTSRFTLVDTLPISLSNILDAIQYNEDKLAKQLLQYQKKSKQTLEIIISKDNNIPEKFEFDKIDTTLHLLQSYTENDFPLQLDPLEHNNLSFSLPSSFWELIVHFSHHIYWWEETTMETKDSRRKNEVSLRVIKKVESQQRNCGAIHFLVRDSQLYFLEEPHEDNDVTLHRLPEGYQDWKYTGLSIDGAGARGIIPALALSCLEEKLKTRRIYEVFDWIGGTSVGGFLALSLTAPTRDFNPIYSARHISNFLCENVKDLFSLPRFFTREYSSLFTHLPSLFGTTNISETLTPCVVSCVRRDSDNLFVFDSEEAMKSTDYLMCDVARASISIPRYFEPVEFHEKEKKFYLFDGGIAAKPPIEIVKEKLERVTTIQNMLLASFTTGCQTTERIDVTGIKSWGSNLVGYSVEESHIHEKLKVNMPLQSYYCIKPEFPTDRIGIFCEDISLLRKAAESSFEGITSLANSLITNYDKKKDIF
eukprot:TRINITY_DN5816_c0_g1_i2.p1 TRINITY_DN5816_c0_g1~~TRINITY_DN5816_c0_g1_i2.p1  ORF type:complete len:2369 (+),score=560.83 TRINITY_DN5816_c0_g1_i2:280-7386(+)